MTLPRPEAGLVIRYSYLWLREHRQGREEGIKDRPCAIILATETQDGETDVLVVPVTHTPPSKEVATLEIPSALKRHLGLDGDRSWAVYSESNVFTWPGPDLRRIGDRDNSSVAYGMLPPRFFAELKRRFLAQELAARGPACETDRIRKPARRAGIPGARIRSIDRRLTSHERRGR